MSAIVVDGISASGKSLLLQGLQRISGESHPNCTKLILTEHLTERFFEKEVPSRAGIHHHVARILRLVNELQSIHAASPFFATPGIVTAMIERLFLTLMSRDLMSIDFFSEHAELVEATALRSVLLIVPEALIKDRIDQSLMHRNQGWRDYINRLGGLSGAALHFHRQQDAMRRANEALSAHIPTQILEIDNPAEIFEDKLLRGILWPDTPAC